MPRTGKLGLEEKAAIVRRCLSGETSIREASHEAGVDWKTVQQWMIRYEAEGMTQSMSRVAHCIDNGRSILKRERYYAKRFTSKQDLIAMIRCYISYYSNRRVQRGLGVLTPMEKHSLALAA